MDRAVAAVVQDQVITDRALAVLLQGLAIMLIVHRAVVQLVLAIADHPVAHVLVTVDQVQAVLLQGLVTVDHPAAQGQAIADRVLVAVLHAQVIAVLQVLQDRAAATVVVQALPPEVRDHIVPARAAEALPVAVAEVEVAADNKM